VRDEALLRQFGDPQGIRNFASPDYSGFAFIGRGAFSVAVAYRAKRFVPPGYFIGEQKLFRFWSPVKAAGLYHGVCAFFIQISHKKNACLCLCRDTPAEALI